MKLRVLVLVALLTLFLGFGKTVYASDLDCPAQFFPGLDKWFSFCGDNPKPPPEPEPEPEPEPTPNPNPVPSGVGGSPGTTDASNATYSCNDSKPNSAPTLEAVKALGGGKVQLTWNAVTPVSHYAIAYGKESGKYLYGQTNVGNTTSYTVTSLAAGQNYCFVVSAVNGCNSSGFSNEQCSGGQVLGTSFGVGQVLGLSNTSGNNSYLALVGLLCLVSGLSLRRLTTR